MNKEQEKKFFELICVCNNQQQELDKYKNIVDKATNYLLDKYVTGNLNDEEINNVVRILKEGSDR